MYAFNLLRIKQWAWMNFREIKGGLRYTHMTHACANRACTVRPQKGLMRAVRDHRRLLQQRPTVFSKILHHLYLFPL